MATTDDVREVRPLRLGVFGESVVSDWGNPAATTWRALLRALTAAGQQAVFHEPRRNRATVAALQARGAGPVRAFAARYPEIHYRTYELPRGLERSLWFGREMATLDAVIVLDIAPPEIHAEARGYDTPRLLAVLQRTRSDEVVSAEGYNLVLTPDATPMLGPVIEVPVVRVALPRDGVVVVAYDDIEAANAIGAALAPLRPRLLTPAGVPAPWRYVPEVDLPEIYGAAEVAVVLPGDASPLAAARLALPLAAGCPTLSAGEPQPPQPPALAVPVVTAATVTGAVAEHRGAPVPPLPPEMRADQAAAGLVTLLRAAHPLLR